MTESLNDNYHWSAYYEYASLIHERVQDLVSLTAVYSENSQQNSKFNTTPSDTTSSTVSRVLDNLKSSSKQSVGVELSPLNEELIILGSVVKKATAKKSHKKIESKTIKHTTKTLTNDSLKLPISQSSLQSPIENKKRITTKIVSTTISQSVQKSGNISSIPDSTDSLFTRTLNSPNKPLSYLASSPISIRSVRNNQSDGNPDRMNTRNDSEVSSNNDLRRPLDILPSETNHHVKKLFNDFPSDGIIEANSIEIGFNASSENSKFSNLTSCNHNNLVSGISTGLSPEPSSNSPCNKTADEVQRINSDEECSPSALSNKESGLFEGFGDELTIRIADLYVHSVCSQVFPIHRAIVLIRTLSHHFSKLKAYFPRDTCNMTDRSVNAKFLDRDRDAISMASHFMPEHLHRPLHNLCHFYLKLTHKLMRIVKNLGKQSIDEIMTTIPCVLRIYSSAQSGHDSSVIAEDFDDAMRQLHASSEEFQNKESLDEIQMKFCSIRPIRDEKYSKNDYRSKDDQAVYNEREKLFDIISNLLISFKDLSKRNKFDNWLQEILPIEVNKILNMKEVNMVWLSKHLIDLLLFHGTQISTSDNPINRNITSAVDSNSMPSYIKPNRKNPSSRSPAANSSTPSDVYMVSSYREASLLFPGILSCFYWLFLHLSTTNHSSPRLQVLLTVCITSKISEVLDVYLPHSTHDSLRTVDKLLSGLVNPSKQDTDTALKTHDISSWPRGDNYGKRDNIDQYSSPDSECFTTTFIQLKILGKFLGLLMFSSQWRSYSINANSTNTPAASHNDGNSGSVGLNVASRRQSDNIASSTESDSELLVINKSLSKQALRPTVRTSDVMEASPVDALIEEHLLNQINNRLVSKLPVLSIIFEALRCKKLCVVVPWIVEFFQMMKWVYSLSSLTLIKTLAERSQGYLVYQDCLELLSYIQISQCYRLNHDRPPASEELSGNRLMLLLELQSLQRNLPSYHELVVNCHHKLSSNDNFAGLMHKLSHLNRHQQHLSPDSNENVVQDNVKGFDRSNSIDFDSFEVSDDGNYCFTSRFNSMFMPSLNSASLLPSPYSVKSMPSSLLRRHDNPQEIRELIAMTPSIIASVTKMTGVVLSDSTVQSPAVVSEPVSVDTVVDDKRTSIECVTVSTLKSLSISSVSSTTSSGNSASPVKRLKSRSSLSRALNVTMNQVNSSTGQNVKVDQANNEIDAKSMSSRVRLPHFDHCDCELLFLCDYISYRTEKAFWQHHQQLYQINLFLTQHCYHSRLARLKDLVVDAIRDLWTVSTSIKSFLQSDFTYVDSHSKEETNIKKFQGFLDLCENSGKVLSKDEKYQYLMSCEASTLLETTLRQAENFLKSFSRSFDCSNSTQNTIKYSRESPDVLTTQQLSNQIIADTTHDDMSPSQRDSSSLELNGLFSLYPNHPQVIVLAKHLTLQQIDQQTDVLLEHINSYAKRKLDEVIQLSHKQFKLTAVAVLTANESTDCEYQRNFVDTSNNPHPVRYLNVLSAYSLLESHFNSIYQVLFPNQGNSNPTRDFLTENWCFAMQLDSYINSRIDVRVDLDDSSRQYSYLTIGLLDSVRQRNKCKRNRLVTLLNQIESLIITVSAFIQALRLFKSSDSQILLSADRMSYSKALSSSHNSEIMSSLNSRSYETTGHSSIRFQSIEECQVIRNLVFLLAYAIKSIQEFFIHQHELANRASSVHDNESYEYFASIEMSKFLIQVLPSLLLLDSCLYHETCGPIPPAFTRVSSDQSTSIPSSSGDSMMSNEFQSITTSSSLGNRVNNPIALTSVNTGSSSAISLSTISLNQPSPIDLSADSSSLGVSSIPVAISSTASSIKSASAPLSESLLHPSLYLVTFILDHTTLLSHDSLQRVFVITNRKPIALVYETKYKFHGYTRSIHRFMLLRLIQSYLSRYRHCFPDLMDVAFDDNTWYQNAVTLNAIKKCLGQDMCSLITQLGQK